MNMFNFGTTFCKRINVKELVTNVPVYGIVSGNVWFPLVKNSDLVLL